MTNTPFMHSKIVGDRWIAGATWIDEIAGSSNGYRQVESWVEGREEGKEGGVEGGRLMDG